MKTKNFLNFSIIFLIILGPILLVNYTTNVKAESTRIKVTWTRLYVTDTYEGDPWGGIGEGDFYLKLAYYTTKWKYTNTAEFHTDVLFYYHNPNKAKIIDNVRVDHDFGFRLREDDGWWGDDDIIYTSGAFEYVYLPLGFTTILAEKYNQYGDFMRITIENLG